MEVGLRGRLAEKVYHWNANSSDPSSFPRGKKPLLFFLSFSRGIFSLPTPTFCTSRNLFCRGLGKSFYCVLVPIHSITRKRGPSHGNANFFLGNKTASRKEEKFCSFAPAPPLPPQNTDLSNGENCVFYTRWVRGGKGFSQYPQVRVGGYFWKGGFSVSVVFY